MFKKQLLTLAVLASIGGMSLAHAEELVPVVDQQANVLPPVEESAAAPEQSSTSLTDTRWYVAPFGTFLATGNSVNNGWGGGLAIGKMLDKHFNVELKGFYQTASGYEGWGPTTIVGGRPYQRITNSGSVDMAGGSADLQYYFTRGKFSPYTVVSLGGMTTNGPGFNHTGLITEGGLGFTYELTDNLLVRSDVRYRYTANFSAPSLNADQNDMVVNLGFVVPFGDKPKAAEYIAPAPVVVPPVAVVDCSATDADADGVNDCNDKCPNTLSGVHVNEYGCWVVDVKFDNDKSDLRHSDVRNPKVAHELEEVANAIVNHPEVNIEVQGHTSHTGTEKRNIKLGNERAATIKKYLSNQHPEIANRLNAQGYSWDRPMEGTDPASPANRRVQLEIRQ